MEAGRGTSASASFWASMAVAAAAGALAMSVVRPAATGKQKAIPVGEAPTPAAKAATASAAERVVNALNGSAVCLAMSVGHRLRLFDAMASLADREPQGSTIAAVAQEAGTNPRYTQEWLGIMACAGIVRLTSGGEETIDSGHYLLPPDGISCLTSRAPAGGNMAVYTQEIPMLTAHADKIVECCVHGGGVGYSEQPPAFSELVAEMGKDKIDRGCLTESFIPSVEGLSMRTARVLDVGCGCGASTIAMATAFPDANITGIDLDVAAIQNAEDERKRLGLGNARFVRMDLLDIADPSWDGAFDWIYCNDVVHDLARPKDTLLRLKELLKSGDGNGSGGGGILSVVDIAAESTHRGNLGNGFAPFLYTISLFHCMTVSLAQEGGAGLGMMWGEQAARKMLRDVGFEVKRCEVPDDTFNCHYLCKRKCERPKTTTNSE